MPRLGLARLLFFIMILFAGTIAVADSAEDIALQNRILENYSNNITTNRLNPKLTIQGGVVTIVANVNSYQALALIEVAASTKGVVDVRTDQIATGANRLSYDAILTAKVKGALVREQAFGEGITLYNLPITMQTTNQIVYLYGVLPNYTTIIRVVNVIYAVPGVRGVVSWLRVPFEQVNMGT